MPSGHRLDFSAFRREFKAQREVGTHNRDAFMCPYINQEDLTELGTLRLFLNSCGRYSPDKFAAADV
jgi:hypothetical protein